MEPSETVNRSPAVVLLSGGLDSAVTAAIARSQGFVVHALTMQYGQRHAVELEAARSVARMLGIENHVFQQIDLRAFGGSALTGDLGVPKGRTEEQLGEGIPVTYVPARNTIFLSFALALAEVIGSTDVFIGVNAVDYSGYPDCRPEFLTAFEGLANLATRAGVEGARFNLHAPLLHLSKAEIIRRGVSLGVDCSVTHSCYDPDAQGRACGACDSCIIRRKGFKTADVPDPTCYSDGGGASG